MHAAWGFGKSIEEGSDTFGDRHEHRGRLEGAPRCLLSTRAIDERAILRLLLDQRCVDFEQSWHACRARILHSGIAEEGVSFVNQIEWTVLFEDSSQIFVCGERRLRSTGRAAPAIARKFRDFHIL